MASMDILLIGMVMGERRLNMTQWRENGKAMATEHT
jgi:hypothetical protein